MEIYKLKIKRCDEITQIPDSHKIFGCLMYKLDEYYKNSKPNICDILIKGIMNKQIQINISNLMPNEYFPVPKDYIINKATCKDCIYDSRICKNSGKCKPYYEKIKKIVYTTKKNINDIINGQKLDICNDNYYNNKYVYQQRVHLVNNLDNIKYIKNMPYSIQKLDISEDYFYFYLSITTKNQEYKELENDIINMLNDIKRYKDRIILGPRATQGLNVYEIYDISKINIKSNKSNYYLNMGMLIPDKSLCYKNSTLSIYTSERKPYNTLGQYHKENYDNRFISFIETGSVIYINDNDLLNISKCVYVDSKKRDIIFGNSFLYPLNLREGVLTIE